MVHLIAKKSAVEDATWFSRYGGDAYLWAGTLVYDGKVYDHIHYRARGGVWRYAMVKNMWKFDFNRGHDFQMRDDYGRQVQHPWTKLNLGACIQQGDYGHRGEQGMFESVGFRLFNLAGVEAPNTTFLQFRIIDDALEADPGNQYDGDFWGLYLAVEQEDGRFLDEHELPDGNSTRWKAAPASSTTSGPLGPADKSDLNAFLTVTHRARRRPTPGGAPTLNLHRLLQLPGHRPGHPPLRHYRCGKNYFYYRNPDNGPLVGAHLGPGPDLGEQHVRRGAGDDQPFKSRVYAPSRLRPRIPEPRPRDPRPALQHGPGLASHRRIRAAAARHQRRPDFLDADRCQWDYNPKMADSAYSTTLQQGGPGPLSTSGRTSRALPRISMAAFSS